MASKTRKHSADNTSKTVEKDAAYWLGPGEDVWQIQSAINKAIGERIYQARMKNKMTVREVADFAGISEFLYFGLESGDWSAAAYTLVLVCCKLDVSLLWVTMGIGHFYFSFEGK